MSPSAARVAFRFLQSSGAPSAEGAFWDNPERKEVRQMAETGAVTNDPEVAADAGVLKELSRFEVRKDVSQARKAPPIPTEIVEDHPGGEAFSTLSRYLVETAHPIGEAIAKRPMQASRVAARFLSDR